MGEDIKNREIGHCINHVSSYIRSLERKIDKLKKQIKDKDNSLHKKNKILDAMHWVWCSGGCETGVHRYRTDMQLTEEIVQLAERNTKRLRSWYNNHKFRNEWSDPKTSIERKQEMMLDSLDNMRKIRIEHDEKYNNHKSILRMYSKMDKLLTNRQFDKVEFALKNIIVGNLSTEMMLGILRITYSGREFYLDGWNSFRDQTRYHLALRNKDVESLMVGLLNLPVRHLKCPTCKVNLRVKSGMFTDLYFCEECGYETR